jgi:hypothetical protein
MGYKFDNVKHNIISTPVLCDNGCEVLLTEANIKVTKNGSPVMNGYRDTATRLWRLKANNPTPTTPIPPTQDQPTHHTHTVNALVPEGTVADMISFLHKAMFSPTTATFLQAAKNGDLATWPDMTPENFTKHLPKSIATALGHLYQQHKNVRSTKPKPPPTTKPTPESDSQPTSENPNKRTHQVFSAIVDAGTGKIYTNQTGKFPVTSSRGNKYVFVLYEYDSNAILVEPIKSRMQDELLRAYRKLTTHLRKRGLTPKLQRLDNEYSQAMKDELDDQNNDVSWQLTPVGIHRRNAAERAIRTFKNHFLAGLASTDDNFLIHLWCRLIPQAQRSTLNLLRTSRINPLLLAEAQLNGQFDYYNRTPLAPPAYEPSFTKNPTNETRGTPMGPPDGTLAKLPTIIAAGLFTLLKPMLNASVIRSRFFPNEVKCRHYHHTTAPSRRHYN